VGIPARRLHGDRPPGTGPAAAVRRRPIRIGLLLPTAAVVIWLAPLGASCGPWGRTPGFALFGARAAGPVLDWGFVRTHPEIALETRTPWLVPHSVTVAWLLLDGDLFIPSRDARGKRWVRNVLQRPQVRLRIGGWIYDARLASVEDASLRQRLTAAALQKWPRFRSGAVDLAAMAFFRVESR